MAQSPLLIYLSQQFYRSISFKNLWRDYDEKQTDNSFDGTVGSIRIGSYS